MGLLYCMAADTVCVSLFKTDMMLIFVFFGAMFLFIGYVLTFCDDDEMTAGEAFKLAGFAMGGIIIGYSLVFVLAFIIKSYA